ncbi:MAG: c-type cytochrome [Alphaproteobacteria bacterium]
MKRRTRATLLMAGVAVAVLGGPVAADATGAASGAAHAMGATTETLARTCSGCHGVEGHSPGKIPTIAGKDEDYLVRMMSEFRDGKRASTIMGRIIKPFADDDIARLAHYFATRK